ncbi:unnamed protein product [Dicrocoelium dendriticum]|nr:unnamed protein product [Dicrocoelium dendriticum]
MLERHGACRLVSEGTQIRYVFFAPSVVRGIVKRYGEVLLCDATHQLNYGGYILWHCMFVDVTGLGISFFYALLPDETSYSYGQAVEAMREMVPSSIRCNTLVMDKCAAQLRAFRRHYPNAKVVFCRFHVKADMARRCGRIRWISDGRRMQLRAWLHNLIYTRDASVFERILNAVRGGNPECYRYLCATWLPHVDCWAAHRLRDVVLFGCHTTNRVENENKHLKQYLSERSSLLTLFTCVVDRVNNIVHERNSMIARRCMSLLSVPSEVSSVACVFAQLTDFAGNVFLAHFRASTVLSCRSDGPYWLVTCPRSKVRRVYITQGSECDCEFSRQWRLPCAHICYVASLHEHSAKAILHGCRWIAPRQPPAASSDSVASDGGVRIRDQQQGDTDAVVSRSMKLRKTQDVLADIGTQLCSYGSDNFSAALMYLKMVALLMSKEASFQLYARTSRCPVPLHLDQEANVRMLCGLSTPGGSHVGAASEVPSTSEVIVPAPVEVTHVNDVSPEIATATPGPSTSTTASRKRKSPLKCRVMEVSPSKSALRGKDFRKLHTRTSSGYKVPVKRKHHTQGLVSEDLCGVCQQEDDVENRGDSVQWVMCDACSKWYHASCVCYAGDEEFICFSCST